MATSRSRLLKRRNIVCILAITLFIGAMWVCGEIVVRRSDLPKDMTLKSFLHMVLTYAHYKEECMPASQTFRLDVLRKALQDFHQVTKKLGIPYWLDFGTLLGAHRSGSFIPWDNDLDIGVLRSAVEPKAQQLIDGMRRRGHVMDPREGCRYVIEHRRNGMAINVDIFLFVPASWNQSRVFYRQYRHLSGVRSLPEVPSAGQESAPNTEVMTRCNQPDYWRYTVPMRFARDLVDVPFEGGMATIPSDAEGLLRSFRYPYSFYISLPYRLNCYFTRWRYAWVPLSLLTTIALLVVMVAKCMSLLIRHDG